VGLHLVKSDFGYSFVHDYIPFPYFYKYFTQVCILLVIISALIFKYNKLAYTRTALYVILMGVLVHLPRSMGHELGTENMTADLMREKELEMVNFFRNIMVTGALLGFAKFVAKDKSIINKCHCERSEAISSEQWFT
jgi:hypothetical protein